MTTYLRGPILIDVPIWQDHFNGVDDRIARLLEDPSSRSKLLVHPYVFGELLLGGISREAQKDLARQPSAMQVADTDVFTFIRYWSPQGVGWVDTHLLVSAQIGGYGIWTRDGKFRKAAQAIRLRTQRNA